MGHPKVTKLYHPILRDGDINLFFFFLQEIAPYNKGAFKIEINFPAEYPFKPPKVSPVSDTMHYATCKLLNF